MEIDRDKIDEAVLALLYLGRHDDIRTWKSFDWDAMGRLHAMGMISDPVGKAKSVVFSEEGLRQAERLFNQLFGVHPISTNQGDDHDAFEAASHLARTMRGCARNKGALWAECDIGLSGRREAAQSCSRRRSKRRFCPRAAQLRC